MIAESSSVNLRLVSEPLVVRKLRYFTYRRSSELIFLAAAATVTIEIWITVIFLNKVKENMKYFNF